MDQGRLTPGCLGAALMALVVATTTCAGRNGNPVAPSASQRGGGGAIGSAAQQYNLQRLNDYRALVDAPALSFDAQLSTFATAGSQQLMSDHIPHKHFTDASSAGTLFRTDGFSSVAAENQGDPNGWPLSASVNAQIDQILAAMWAEGPGPGAAHGHYHNMIDGRFRRVGIGLVLDGTGKLYFTNDFSQ